MRVRSAEAAVRLQRAVVRRGVHPVALLICRERAVAGVGAEALPQQLREEEVGFEVSLESRHGFRVIYGSAAFPCGSVAGNPGWDVRVRGGQPSGESEFATGIQSQPTMMGWLSLELSG